MQQGASPARSLKKEKKGDIGMHGIFKSKITKNALWLIGGKILYKLVAFLVGVAVARYLGPADYGLLGYASAFTTFFFSLATLGIHSVIVKKLVEAPENGGTVLGTVLLLQGISSLFSIFMISGLVLLLDRGEPLTIAVVLLNSLGLFFQMLDVMRYWFQSRLESRYAAIAMTASYLIASLYKLWLVLSAKSVLWFAAAVSIDHLMAAAILFALYIRKKGPKLRVSSAVARELLQSSYPFILSGLMVAVYGATDKWMLKQLLGEEAVGYYGTALSLSGAWVFVLAAIIDSMKPDIMRLCDTDRTAYRKKNLTLYRIVFYLSVLMGLFITVFAEQGILFLYGASYLGATAPLRIVTWYVAFSYLGVARDIWVICEGLQRHLPGLYIGSAVINVMLNVLLIPPLGAVGAAAATLITQVSTILVMPLLIPPMRPNLKLMLDAILFKHERRN